MYDMRHKEQSAATLLQIRSVANLHKVTNIAIAEKMGISKQAVGGMLSGKFSPTLDTVYKILNAIEEISDVKICLEIHELTK